MEQDIDGLEYGSDEENSRLQSVATDSFESVAAGALLLPKIKTKSEMVFTDHSKVYYRPFKKNFYVEVPEISQMSEQEVQLYRLELEDIKVKGKNCPRPIKTWAQCGVSYKISECLKKNM
jgi:ATP-dependent RNA helicase DDX46/PRP5